MKSSLRSLNFLICLFLAQVSGLVEVSMAELAQGKTDELLDLIQTGLSDRMGTLEMVNKGDGKLSCDIIQGNQVERTSSNWVRLYRKFTKGSSLGKSNVYNPDSGNIKVALGNDKIMGWTLPIADSIFNRLGLLEKDKFTIRVTCAANRFIPDDIIFSTSDKTLLNRVYEYSDGVGVPGPLASTFNSSQGKFQEKPTLSEDKVLDIPFQDGNLLDLWQSADNLKTRINSDHKSSTVEVTVSKDNVSGQIILGSKLDQNGTYDTIRSGILPPETVAARKIGSNIIRFASATTFTELDAIIHANLLGIDSYRMISYYEGKKLIAIDLILDTDAEYAKVISTITSSKSTRKQKSIDNVIKKRREMLKRSYQLDMIKLCEQVSPIHKSKLPPQLRKKPRPKLKLPQKDSSVDTIVCKLPKSEHSLGAILMLVNTEMPDAQTVTANQLKNTVTISRNINPITNHLAEIGDQLVPTDTIKIDRQGNMLYLVSNVLILELLVVYRAIYSKALVEVTFAPGKSGLAIRVAKPKIAQQIELDLPNILKRIKQPI